MTMFMGIVDWLSGSLDSSQDTETHRNDVMAFLGGCKKFCVNGHSATNGLRLVQEKR
jgi:hypothetical protein